ncbi:hypothetical protein FNV43_RR09857 [Rhamnella rubrinervis]|uniref:Abietadienol/abietadienal oxidase n=1 Tax=Rhamnella rubrinervis TaxID=2594499 RepID=A0A8K0HC12_9ROSA|nr:hypothetical protein FNV43_RR09857 [Rhamnella rubrinervis]
MRPGTWLLMITTLLFVVFIAKFLLRKKKKNVAYKLPPGRRGWPLIGDSFNWYRAVASSHPPQFVEEQVKRFGKIFSCSLFGKWAVRFGRQNGVITVQGEQQRKLHGIASNMLRLDKVKFHFMEDIQRVILQTLSSLQNNQVAINLMVNQLLGVSSESEVNEMAQLFSDFVDGCLSVPINLPGMAYHTGMKVEHENLRSKSSTVGEEMLTWQDYKAMSFTQCVIDETLRLGGIAIWLMREVKEDVVYQDYVIPKGCFVVPFLSAVHLDENVYNGALTFNPWRWIDPENQEKRNWRSSQFYAPFGGGARFCPGAELARFQIALFLHYFVTTYGWRQVKEDQMSFFPSARLVNGFQICLTRRHHDPANPKSND